MSCNLNIDVLSAIFFNIMNHTGSQGKQRIVFSRSHIFTGFNFSASLPDDDGTGVNLLSAKNFNAQTLGVALTSVFPGAT